MTEPSTEELLETVRLVVNPGYDIAPSSHDSWANAGQALDFLETRIAAMKEDAFANHEVWGNRYRKVTTALRAQRDEAVSLLQELLDEQVSCDTDNPHVAVWCIMHQAKRCHMDDIVARGRDFLSLLAELGEGP